MAQINIQANYYDSLHVSGSGICNMRNWGIEARQWKTKANVFRKGF